MGLNSISNYTKIIKSFRSIFRSFCQATTKHSTPMECCPVYFLSHANTGQPHSCAPKLGGFRLLCGIPVRAEVEARGGDKGGEDGGAIPGPVNDKHLSPCGPLAPPWKELSLPVGHVTREGAVSGKSNFEMTRVDRWRGKTN